MGSNSKGNLNSDIESAIKEIEGLKNNRQSINAKINEIRLNLEGKGIPRKAFDMALQYLNWDEDKREGFDLAYRIVRAAAGVPVEADLVDQMEKGDAGESTAGE